MDSEMTTATRVIEISGVKYGYDGTIEQSTLRMLGSDDLYVSLKNGSNDTAFSAAIGYLAWVGIDGMTLFSADSTETGLNRVVSHQGTYFIEQDDGPAQLYFSVASNNMDLYVFKLAIDPTFPDGFSDDIALEFFMSELMTVQSNENMVVIFNGTEFADTSTTTHIGSLLDLEQGKVNSVDPTTTDPTDPDTNTGVTTEGGTDGGTEGGSTGVETAQGQEIFGTDQDDTIIGTAGDDTIMGYDGNDLIYAGDGNDLIFGHQGNDTLFGENGNDTVWASDGDDYVEGGDGDDRLGVGHGKDTVDGGAGNDTIVKISGDGSISGGTENDILIGGYQKDRIVGGAGDDWIRGDISSVVGGMDTIEGGTGDDILSGGSAQDTFIFRPNQGNDKIAFFEMTESSMNGVLNLETDLSRDWDTLDQVHLIGFSDVDRSNVMSFVEQGENGAVLTLQGTRIEFFDVSVDELSAEDFYFG